MIKAQKNAARLLAQTETAGTTRQHYYTTTRENLQIHYYAPTPSEIAYVAYDGNRDGYGIVVSPCCYNPRGLWYADDLPGRWKSEAIAQAALDDLADAEGWPLINALNQERFGHDDEY